MRWVVVGAGGIGAGLGGALARVGESVHLVARGAHLEALRSSGLRWRTPEHDERLQVPVSHLDEVSPGPDDVVCLATKLQDAHGVLALVRDRWGDVPVVTWTNGLLAHQWAARWASTVVATVLFVPATFDVPGEVGLWGVPHFGAVHAGTVRGEDDTVRDALVRALNRAGFDAHSHTDVTPVQRTKWMRNLGGAVQALVVPEDWEQLAAAVVVEGRAVLGQVGAEQAPLDALVPVPLRLGTIDGEQRGGGSTWQSLRSGRPLETRWLNGALVDLAQTHGLTAPLNAWLTAGAERAMAEGWREGRLRAGDAPISPGD